MRHDEAELPPSSLRGRLCEVFFTALVAEMIDPLMRRLGDKAELDDPVFGATAGNGVRPRLLDWVRFLGDHDAAYDRTITIVGSDRDVTEGTLEARVDGQHRTVPIAVLMERRREREVGLRVYCGVKVFGKKPSGPSAPSTKRPPIPGSGEGAAVPSFVADLLVAIAKRDPTAMAACFEQESSVRDAFGVEHPREGLGRVLGSELAIAPSLWGVADNGQACAVEVMVPEDRRLALLVMQRGDSGLVRSLRIYSEV